MQSSVVHPLLMNADTYGEPMVAISSAKKDVFVISDLHLAAGLNESNNYNGTENFFADQSFVRFIDSLEEKQSSKGAILVINGDFIDFLRIRNVPETDNQFSDWVRILQAAGITKTREELRTSIVKKEITYGLRTNDYKSVWKLHICIQGHKMLFERLAVWLYNGNYLVITKGNHDLEWYWKAVRVYLQYGMAGLLADKLQLNLETLLPAIFSHTIFADNAVVIDEKIYIEHGHCYESMTAVKGDVLSGNKEELNLPFGSFFNRYLINRIELAYPFIDNVRPCQNMLLILLRERFPLALKMIACYVPFTLLLIPKKLYWETFKYLLTFLLIIVLPLVITGFAIHKSIQPIRFSGNPSWIVQQLLGVIKNGGLLFLSYLFGRIMVMVKLKEPGSFIPQAATIFHDNSGYQVVTFGHTHNPEQRNINNKWYFNTGTWMPIFETSSADVRADKTYTFLHLRYDADKLVIQPLQRWNDEALRYEYLTLNEKK